MDLVVDDGFAGFSMHKLAEQLELTVGALYRYFASRDEVLVAVQVEVLEGFRSYLERTLELLVTSPPLERVAQLVRAYTDLERLQPHRFRLIALAVASPEELFDDEAVKPALARMFGLLTLLAGTLDVAVEEGALEPGDPERRAFLFWSSFQALVDRRKLMRGTTEPFDRDEMIDSLTASLLRGWGGDPTEIERALKVPRLDTGRLEGALELNDHGQRTADAARS